MSEQQLDRQASRLSLREQIGSRLQSFRGSRVRERKRSQDEPAIKSPKGPEALSPRSREGLHTSANSAAKQYIWFVCLHAAYKLTLQLGHQINVAGVTDVLFLDNPMLFLSFLYSPHCLPCLSCPSLQVTFLDAIACTCSPRTIQAGGAGCAASRLLLAGCRPFGWRARNAAAHVHRGRP